MSFMVAFIVNIAGFIFGFIEVKKSNCRLNRKFNMCRVICIISDVFMRGSSIISAKVILLALLKTHKPSHFCVF